MGLYRFTKMPMGLKTASGMFCRCLDGILGKLRYEDVIIYLDDLLLASDTFEKHIESLEIVFARLDKAGITL